MIAEDSFNCWWYVLFVKANAERRVIGEIKQFATALSIKNKIEPFILESEQYYRNKKYQKLGHKYQKRPLFPGYVFIETDIHDEQFLELFSDYIYRSESIIRILTTYNKNKLALSEEEKTRLEYWCLGHRCIVHSEGYAEGEKIVVTSGPLIGKEAQIKRINRHNRCAYVELEFMGTKQLIKVAIELIKKV